MDRIDDTAYLVYLSTKNLLILASIIIIFAWLMATLSREKGNDNHPTGQSACHVV